MRPPQVEAPRAGGHGDEAQREAQTDRGILRASEAERKCEATVTALLAIHGGHVVHPLRGGEFLVVWRGCMRHCRDLTELEAHARRVGAMR